MTPLGQVCRLAPALFLLLSSWTWAEEQCAIGCHAHDRILDLSRFVGEVAPITYAVLVDKNGEVHFVEKEVRDAQRQALLAAQYGPPECLKHFEVNQDMWIQALNDIYRTVDMLSRANVPIAVPPVNVNPDDLKPILSDKSGGDFLTQYFAFSAASLIRCKNADPRNLPKDCQGREGFERVRQFLDRPDGDVLADLRVVQGIVKSDTQAEDLKLFRAYSRVLGANTDEGFERALQNEGKHLDRQQKMRLVQMFGAHREGKFSLSEYLRSIRPKTGSGFFTQEQIAELDSQKNPSEAYAGVAEMQAKMLKVLGVPDPYIVEYVSATGLKRGVVAFDPDRRALILFDYGGGREVRDREGGQGLGELLQDGTAMTFDLLTPEGKRVQRVSSEFKEFVTRAAGFSIQTIEPFAVTTTSIQGLERALDDAGNSKVTAFLNGADGLGSQYNGVSLRQSLFTNTTHPAALGVVAGSKTRPDLTVDFGYVHYEQRLKTGTVYLGNTEIYGQSTLTGAAALTRGRLYLSPLLLQPDVRIEGGVRVNEMHPEKIPLMNHVINSSYYAGVQTIPFKLDGGVQDWGLPAINYGVLSAETRMKLGEQGLFDARVIATLLCSESLDCAGKTELEAIFKKVALSLAYQGGINRRVSAVREGVARRVSGGMKLPGAILLPMITNPQFLIETGAHFSLDNSYDAGFNFGTRLMF